MTVSWVIEQILMTGLLIPMTIEDLKKQVLNPYWMIFLMALGIMMNLSMNQWKIADIVTGMLIGTILIVISKVNDSIGTGDGVLFLAAGVICGWESCLLLLTGSLLLCLPAGIFLKFVKHKSGEDRIPFAPFVLASWGVQLVLMI